jgi:hypothetical protein
MGITLTRRELYERVWAEPVDTLAKEFGVSNVGLGKACRRHEIPVPPRRYWGRKAAGQNLQRPPLPPAKSGDETITLLGSSVPDAPAEEHGYSVHPLIVVELEPQNRITVPDDLRVRHPAIAQTKAYWAAQNRGEVNYRDNKMTRLNVSVSKQSLPRALRLLQALFTALEHRGHKVAATKEGKTIFIVLDEALEVSLREPNRQVPHVPTAKELADAKRYSWMKPAPYDLVSSGTLILNIENVWDIRHTWKDGKTQRLEEVLNDVVVGLLEAALQKKERREEQERERLRVEEIERQREVARQRFKQERARVRRFERLRAASREHDDLLAFLGQLQITVGEVDERSEIGRWLEWASGYLKRTDPLQPFRAPAESLRLYHGTSSRTADEIMRTGFMDRDVEYGEEKDLPASVVMLDAPAFRDTYDLVVVEVAIPEAVVLPYELITQTRSYRCFMVPAEVVNEHGRVSRSKSDS